MLPLRSFIRRCFGRPHLGALLAVAIAPGLAPTAATADTTVAPGPTSAQITGVPADQLTTTDLCASAQPGHAQCDAQAIVLRSDDRAAHVPYGARPTFTQVFPWSTAGIQPAATTTPAALPSAGSPAYLQQAYDLTYLSQTHGAADTVAIVDAYDDPNAAADLATYRSANGLPACTLASGCLRKVNQNGATAPLPAGNSGWEGEISLDLDAVSALCPLCHILLVEANTSSLTDLDQAEVEAAALGANQISDSWSANSSSVLPGTFTFPRVAVIAATGDAGYDGPGWDAYPAALPTVTAAGGTTLTPTTTATAAARGYTETAWSLSGGEGGGSGCDLAEAKPSFQHDTGCTGRSYADVSADANPSTGLVVYDSANGGWLLYGGTSLASPLVAAFEAVTGVGGGAPAWPYSDSALLNDPLSGSVGGCSGAIAYICNAGVGFDGPTGAGSISGDIAPGAPGIGGPDYGSGNPTTNTYTQSVSGSGATLSGGVYPNGVDTTYEWQYGPTTAYGSQTPATDIGSGSSAVVVHTTLAGLAANTTYHYRLVAQNATGTSYGYDVTLTTGAASGAPPVATSAPVISGTAVQGQTLHFASSWTGAVSTTDQWLRSTNNGSTYVPISGATGTTYTLGTGDLNALIKVAVTATNPYGSTASTSTAVGPVASGAPVTASAPVISGTPTVGQTVRFASTWTNATSLSYQWLRSTNNGAAYVPISGATGTTYTLGTADLNALIKVTVTATNPYGSTASTSTAIGPVTSGAPTVLSAPVISGTLVHGQPLHVTSTWTGGILMTYQWLRSVNGGTSYSPIAGANGATYVLAGADIGAKIEVTVTSMNNVGTTAATSAPVGPIK